MAAAEAEVDVVAPEGHSSAMQVTSRDIRMAIRTLGLAGRPLCLHSSLRSFGWVEGGASTIAQALLDEGCTVLVPTFSWDFAVPPPAEMRPPRNGWDYDRVEGPTAGINRLYDPATTEIDRKMGAVPAAVLRLPGRVRGGHPLNSFAAIGPLARDLVAGQGPQSVYAPLRALAGADGWVVLMGVGLTAMTFIHLAEQQAGRNLFRRWANGPDERPVEVEVGGCSLGFGRLESVLAPLARETLVGPSHWRAFPAAATLDIAARIIRADPRLTRCGDPACERCNDAVLGGPILGSAGSQ